MISMGSYIIIFVPVLLAIFYSMCVYKWSKKRIVKDGGMQKISRSIRKESITYLNRQYKIVALIVVILAVPIFIFLGWKTTIGFIIGSVVSGFAGYVGMMVSTGSNAKTAEAAKGGIMQSFSVAFRSGSVTGIVVVSLGLLAVSGFYIIFRDFNALIGLAFGASLTSIFARLGGGIYTGSADIGTDLAGKIDINIPEDDLRNPGVMADNIGDNVGDSAGMATDLFETYVVTLVASILLSITVIKTSQSAIFPLVLGGVSILASLASLFFVKLGKKKSIMWAFYRGVFVSILLTGTGFYFVSRAFFGAGAMSVFLSSIVGLLVTVFIFLATDYYTSKRFRPVKSISDASDFGDGMNIIMGTSVSMESTVISIIVIILGIFTSFILAGLYGVAIASVGMLSLAGIVISIDSFGPIVDNAGGIAEMTHQDEEIRNVTDQLDAVGNTAKAITKGYAIGSAVLATLVLFSSYVSELNGAVFDLSNYKVIIGLLIGVAIPYFFGALILKSVGKTATFVVREIKSQFRKTPEILEGTLVPDYNRVVNIVTKASVKEMIVPAVMPILVVLFVGFIFGSQVLGGLLIGVIISGVLIALSMTSGGASWDNAKKYIEEGNYGGKGSQAHKASITGDIVGDSYKDIIGPAINPLIKVINILALLIVKFLI